ncbi:hypothetical protein FDA45_03570 [Clostridium botulinum]|nr:hypothetical protein [Clostridium botulinum]NFH96042.1 hypothetical protein [Clostridium botulinum]NFI24166.1 hypothetical protein [Clostridium botulinum]NFI27252.1 hypothetical protein [Clostridium botulinum]NFI36594.1 hypothetical protein [Clostridium botulinum]
MGKMLIFYEKLKLIIKSIKVCIIINELSGVNVISQMINNTPIVVKKLLRFYYLSY